MSNPFSRLQNVLPQHGLSRLVGRLTSSRTPWLKDALIRSLSQFYEISLADAARKQAADYHSFDDFFTRELAPGARPLPDAQNALVSPADGTISQCGPVAQGMLMQAKGIHYRLGSLLYDEQLARQFEGGWFATVYLAPADYHRVHVPFDGTLVGCTAIPGQLFSVNARTEAGIRDLFCRNERLVCRFDTAFGPMVVILVGALIVASIDTVWDGPRSPYPEVRQQQLALPFARGDELGRFRMGSTAIVLTPPGALDPDTSLAPGVRVQMGQSLGVLTGV